MHCSIICNLLHVMFAIRFDELFSLNGSVYEMDTKVNASNAQGCDNACPSRGIIRSSSSLRALNTEKNKKKMKFKNSRKVLRISTLAPPSTGSHDNDEDDLDYVPTPLTRVIT